MAKPVDIGTRVFPTQKAAIDHFSRMLHRYQDNDAITDPGDHADLCGLIDRYDLARIQVGKSPKSAGGIDFFQRRRNQGIGWDDGAGFWIVREDGSETDFSFYRAVQGRPKTESEAFIAACRAAVAPDIARAKRAFFVEHADADGRVPCEITGTLLTIEEAHMDHAWPVFSVMVAGFRAARGWSVAVAEGVVTPSEDGRVQSEFIDADVAEAFRAYHHCQAKLRVVSQGVNLSMASRARIPTIKRPVKLAA